MIKFSRKLPFKMSEYVHSNHLRNVLYIPHPHESIKTLRTSKLLEDVIVITGHYQLCANVIYNFETTNIIEMVSLIANSGDGYLCYTIACCLNDRFHFRLDEIIEILIGGVIRSGDIEWCCAFLMNIVHGRHNRLRSFVLKEGGEKHIMAYLEWEKRLRPHYTQYKGHLI